MIRTIVFDFGNVVGFFDHRITVARLLGDTPLTADELLAAVYGGTLETDYETGRLTTAEFVARALAAGKLTCSPGKFADAFADIFTPNPAVCDAVPALAAKYRLVLASNTNDLHFAHFNRQFADVLKHFAHLGTSFGARFRKPEPGFFAHVHRFCDAAPDECLFVDDLPANVAAARAFGWRAEMYAGGPLPVL